MKSRPNQKITVRPDGSLRVQEINDQPTLARQEFKKDCDINEIIKKYKKTGQITHIAANQGKYLDLTGVTDYHDSMNKVLKAQDAFNSLPSVLRNRFKNDPSKLLEFIQDDKNYNEASELGLVPKKQKPVEETPKTPDDKKQGES